MLDWILAVSALELRKQKWVPCNWAKNLTSTAQVSDKILLLARTSQPSSSARRTDGLTLFYTNLDQRFVEIREIEKMGSCS